MLEYVNQRATRDYTPLYPDADATYIARYQLDVSQLQPQIACPHEPDNVTNLADVIGQPIQQAFLGTCTNGQLEDIAAAAEVLQGKKVCTRMIVIPASAQVMLAATKAGYIETLVEAGAAIGTPGCGPCMGNHMGIPAPDEVTISTANRNFNGRMGTPNTPVYLSNPYVVAASALTGRITNPREFLA